jgi:ribose 5-phosphate isomerase A
MPTEGPLAIDEMKHNAARAAIEFLEPGILLGVGSGTTVWAFIEELAASGMGIVSAVSASDETSRRLRAIGIDVLDLDARHPAIYIDGADEIDMSGCAIKGGGAAHRREKAIALSAEHWVCIVDAGKVVTCLGGVPIPLEVEEDAIDSVKAAIGELGGTARLREGVITDSGNPVLDATGFTLSDAEGLEAELDAIPGVIENGIFARRRADVILIGRASGGVSRVVPHRFGGYSL